MNSIAALLQAAEYLESIERREKEVEHGYASTLPGPFALDDSSSYTQISNHTLVSSVSNLLSDHPSNFTSRRLTKSNNRKPQGNRSTHNELEKNRRAHLRNCLEKLKDIVPLGGDSSRHTTLGLLNKAKHFIRALEDKERKASSHRENLMREQRYLRRRLELLSTQVDAIHKRRSVSECSTSTVSSSHSSASESDEHELVDVIGYGGASDDDHSSIRSGSSDGGVTVTTWRQLSIGGEAWKQAKKWTTKPIIVLPLKKPIFSYKLDIFCRHLRRQMALLLKILWKHFKKNRRMIWRRTIFSMKKKTTTNLHVMKRNIILLEKRKNLSSFV